MWLNLTIISFKYASKWVSQNSQYSYNDTDIMCLLSHSQRFLCLSATQDCKKPHHMQHIADKFLIRFFIIYVLTFDIFHSLYFLTFLAGAYENKPRAMAAAGSVVSQVARGQRPTADYCRLPALKETVSDWNRNGVTKITARRTSIRHAICRSTTVLESEVFCWALQFYDCLSSHWTAVSP